MADFFLARKGNESILAYAKAMQRRRGLDREREFPLACGTLLLYRKQLVEAENYYIGEKISVFCVGSLAYKGLSYSESLEAIAEEYGRNDFDPESLRGEYVLILDDGLHTAVYRDGTGMYKLFSDRADRFLTSSFFAAVSCTRCTLNELAVAEQFMYGFVSAPDTLVNEISCVCAGKYELKKDWFSWGEHKRPEPVQKSKDIHSSVMNQKKEICRYLQDVSALVRQYGCECGLSGGCDSRLVFFSVNSCCEKMASVHTHNTSNGHEKEIAAVRRITEVYDTPVLIVPTVHLMDCAGEEIDRTLEEIVLFFDGRNAETIGSCNQTYTRWYREKTANGSGVTFSGIGGEIYRDFYYTRLKKYKIRSWLEDRIFQKHIDRVIPQQTYQNAVDHIISKIRYFTDTPEKGEGSPRFAKRYFDQYRIPNALGNVIHANNQMNFFLAPFTDERIIARAKPDDAYQDHCGEYEGRILKTFQEKAPEILSSKGYSFSNIPVSVKAKWKLRSVLPLPLWKIRRAVLDKPNERYKNEFLHKFPKSRYITEAMAYFASRFPQWRTTPLEKGEIYINPFVFAVCTIYEINRCSLREG